LDIKKNGKIAKSFLKKCTFFFNIFEFFFFKNYSNKKKDYEKIETNPIILDTLMDSIYN